MNQSGPDQIVAKLQAQLLTLFRDAWVMRTVGFPSPIRILVIFALGVADDEDLFWEMVHVVVRKTAFSDLSVPTSRGIGDDVLGERISSTSISR